MAGRLSSFWRMIIWHWIIEEDRTGQRQDKEDIDFAINISKGGQKWPTRWRRAAMVKVFVSKKILELRTVWRWTIEQYVNDTLGSCVLMNIIVFPVLLGLADRHLSEVLQCEKLCMKYAVGICAISQRFGGRFFWHLNLQGWSTVNRQMAAWSSWLLFVLLHFSKYIKIMMFAFMCTLYTVQLYRKPNKYTKIQIRGWWWGKGLVAMSSMPLNLRSSSTFGLNVCVFSRWWEPGHHWFFTPKYKLWGTRRLLIFTREHLFVWWIGSCVTEL